MGVAVVQRLHDQHTEFRLVGAFVEDLELFRIQRLWQETLPALRGLVDPRFELVEAYIVAAIDPRGPFAAIQSRYIAGIRMGAPTT